MAEPSCGAPSMGRSDRQEDLLSERRRYRKFTAQQKTELVLAALKGQKSIAEVARERDNLRGAGGVQFLGGAEKLAGKAERTQLDELGQRNARLERAVGRKDDGVGDLGGAVAGMGVRQRVARSERPWRASQVTLVRRSPSGRRTPKGQRRALWPMIAWSWMSLARSRLTAPGWLAPSPAGSSAGR